MSALALRINPDLLVWAREQQGVSLDWAMSRSGFTKLPLWETGDEHPTMPQLRKLAHVYRRPSALFFLPNAPKAGRAIVDFRRHVGATASPLSPEARTEIRVCESRRTRAIELAGLLGIETKAELPPVSVQDDVESVAELIRSGLGIDASKLSALKDEKAVLEYWIARIEACGVLVFQSITLNSFNASFKEIRGTSAYYDAYPWILLNSQEHERAQLFTLVHEFAHLLLRDGGVCTLEESESAPDEAVERFCNAVSAAALMPRAAVSALLRERSPDVSDEAFLDAAVDRLTRRFRVSREAAARRLVTLGHAKWAYYQAIRAAQLRSLDLEREQNREKDEGGGGQYYYKRVLAWNGTVYCTLVLDAYHRQRISVGEAAESLRTKLPHMESLERELYG